RPGPPRGPGPGRRGRAGQRPVQPGPPPGPPGRGVRVPQPVPGRQLGPGRRRASPGDAGAAPVRGRPARPARRGGPQAARPAPDQPGPGLADRHGPPGGHRARAAGGDPPPPRLPSLPTLSIVLPCLDEAERLPGTLAAYLAHFPPSRSEVELIVVDDGSTDGTTVIADQIAAADPRALGGGATRPPAPGARVGQVGPPSPPGLPAAPPCCAAWPARSSTGPWGCCSACRTPT